ncbi:hypothetical protein FHL15_007909 [Xylaria flabelliformis]|uniref:Uncharacterized protein n=1 Tax=Xylaria flabelliformis TaxID=2512241 RepID=A0A553HT61_9PEZI|nr:hypothetical protein FHL15_007909 [Xylaria flabelliformis]
MTQAFVVRQLTDSTEKSPQTSRTSIETGVVTTASEGIKGHRPNGNDSLVESNLRSLPTRTPLSDWLSRDDDPFPRNTLGALGQRGAVDLEVGFVAS